jgi:DNA-binding transcriptional MerR regulator
VADLTIDELGREAGVPVSTVRMYQARGLLPGPTKRGRVGFYGSHHLARLDVIARLQEQGFSLAAIKQLVDAWENGRGLDEVLGVHDQLLGLDRERVRVQPGELADMLDGAELTPDVMKRALDLGMVEPADDGTVTIPDAEFLRIGRELLALGLSTDEVLDEYEHLQRAASTVAERFVAVFDRHFAAEADKAARSADDAAQLSNVLDQLQGLAARVVAAAMRQALSTAAATRLAELAAETKPRRRRSTA